MPSELKLHYPQRHVGADTIKQRLELSRWYVALTRIMCDLTFPDDPSGFGSNVELLLVLMGVFIGDAEGRPTTATKISSYCGIPRATVYRRLDRLIQLKKVARDGQSYHLAPGASVIDRNGQLPKILRKFPFK